MWHVKRTPPPPSPPSQPNLNPQPSYLATVCGQGGGDKISGNLPVPLLTTEIRSAAELPASAGSQSSASAAPAASAARLAADDGGGDEDVRGEHPRRDGDEVAVVARIRRADELLQLLLVAGVWPTKRAGGGRGAPQAQRSDSGKRRVSYRGTKQNSVVWSTTRTPCHPRTTVKVDRGP